MTIMLVFFLSTIIRLFRMGVLSSLWGLVWFSICIYWGYFVLTKGKIDLVKVIKTEGSTQLLDTSLGADVAKESVRYRKLFFAENGYRGVYPDTYEIEVCNPQTGAWSGRYRVPVRMDNSGRNLMVKIGNETPELLQKQGVEFKLYLDEKTLAGVTIGEAGEPGNQFYITLNRPRAEAKLDEKQYYKAVMELESGEEPYYLITDLFDSIDEAEDHMSYEVILFHYLNDTGKLPIPTSFRLYQADGALFADGTVDSFFKNRNIIKREVPKELMKWY